jgi:hypothetical protein
MASRRYKLEKKNDVYQVTNSDANEVSYSNEPDDCSAAHQLRENNINTPQPA